MFTYGPYLICKYTQTCTCRKSSHTTSFFFIWNSSQLVLVCKNTGACTVYSMPKAPLCEYTCMCLYVCSKSSLKQLGQLKPNFIWNHNGIGEENLFKGFRSFVVLHLNIASLWGPGAFRGAFTTNVAPQCRAFSRALKIEKLKAPLFRGPKGAGDTNDRCITFKKLS